MGKGYFKRVLGMCKTWELVYWWIMRLLMLGGIILRLVDADSHFWLLPARICLKSLRRVW